MSAPKGTATGRRQLQARIEMVERRIRQRRSDAGATLGKLSEDARKMMTAPSTIVAAAVFGVLMHRRHHLRNLKQRRLAPGQGSPGAQHDLGKG